MLPPPPPLCRGRLMNRAARVADKAGSGQVWVTSNAWDMSEAYELSLVAALGLHASHLGSFMLKGLASEVEIVQVTSG